MDRLFAELLRNQLQKFIADGLQHYISVGRHLKKIVSSLVIFQILLMGIHVGLLLAILPWLSTYLSRTALIGLSAFGAVLMLGSISALVLWNSERFWVNRLGLNTAFQAIEKGGHTFHETPPLS